MTDICVIGGDGFVGFSLCSELKIKKTNFLNKNFTSINLRETE